MLWASERRIPRLDIKMARAKLAESSRITRPALSPDTAMNRLACLLPLLASLGSLPLSGAEKIAPDILNGTFNREQASLFTNLSFPSDPNHFYQLEICGIHNGINVDGIRFEVLAGWENGIMLQAFDGVLDSYFRADGESIMHGRVELTSYYSRPYDIRIRFCQTASGAPWTYYCSVRPAGSDQWISGPAYETDSEIDLSGGTVPVGVNVVMDGANPEGGWFEKASIVRDTLNHWSE